MRRELVLLAGGLAIGWPLGCAINSLRNFQWGWGIGFLVMAVVFGALVYRFVRRHA
jgi:hypothetical protein